MEDDAQSVVRENYDHDLTDIPTTERKVAHGQDLIDRFLAQNLQVTHNYHFEQGGELVSAMKELIEHLKENTNVIVSARHRPLDHQQVEVVVETA